MKPDPFVSVFRTLSHMFHGRLHFPRDRIGEVIQMYDGEEFTIFRQVIVDPTPKQPAKPQAEFRVLFKVTRMSAQQNKPFSLIPIPFITGLPGFRSKLWMVNENTGFNQGLYEWDTVEEATFYANSFAMQFMRNRSIPNSVTYEIHRTS